VEEPAREVGLAEQRSIHTRRACSASSRPSESSTGASRASGISAHEASSYGLIVGFSSLTANFSRA
jgi:hypothetical protein